MSDRCPRIEELGEVLARPPEDPVRRHVAECPRCQARLTTYEEFLRGAGEHDEAQVAAAVDRLGDALEREILGAGAGAAPGAAPIAQRGRGGKILHFRSPLVRGALAAAAAVLLFVALDGLRDRPPDDATAPGELRLRSEEAGRPAESVTLAEPRRLPDGGVELSWESHPGAGTYVVRILDAGLDEVARLPAGADLSLRLADETLQGLLPGPGAYAWLVVALDGGDEVARSRTSSFRYGAGEGAGGSADTDPGSDR
jgi:hypothetical protein